MVYNGIESDRRVVEMDVSKSAIAVLFDVDGTLISSGGRAQHRGEWHSTISTGFRLTSGGIRTRG
jgi:hypothetical protein